MAPRSPLVKFLIGVGVIVIVIAALIGLSGMTYQRNLPQEFQPLSSGSFIAALVLGVIGLLMVIGGFIANSSGSSGQSGPAKVDPRAYVVAKYAYREGRPAVSEWEFDDPGTRFYVRLRLSDDRQHEFECIRAVHEMCGEGMTGEASYKGKWLGSFRGYVGVPQP